MIFFLSVATMKVYQDFFAYKSGVYKKSGLEKTEAFGYHSVRIIGWGEEPDIYGQPVKYWVSENKQHVASFLHLTKFFGIRLKGYLYLFISKSKTTTPKFVSQDQKIVFVFFLL